MWPSVVLHHAVLADDEDHRFVGEREVYVLSSSAAACRFEHASGHLSAALAEWRGPVLEDLRDFQFVEAFAAALTEDKLVTLTVRAESEIDCGRTYSMISELEARLKTALADDLGIDPGPTLQRLHQRILRQEPLDTQQVARATAKRVAVTRRRPTEGARESVVAHLRDAGGSRHPLRGTATRIGRLSDNDIVVDDDTVSRHHAVIIDTGNSFVITDLRSANGVDVGTQRIRTSATLADSDRICICGHEFTFEM